MADDYYPPTGFHFSVAFDGMTQSSQDTRFQSVTGLSVSVETEEFREGGENRFKHRLPIATRYDDLELKRGLTTHSELILWCRDAIEQFEFSPRNVVISLLDETHAPVASWQIVQAIPTAWSMSDLDAQRSEIAVETLRLQYQYFRNINL